MDRIFADRGLLRSYGRKDSLSAIESNDFKTGSLPSLPRFHSIKASARDSFQPLYNGENQSSLSHARISGQEQSHPSPPVVSMQHPIFLKTPRYGFPVMLLPLVA